MAYLSKNLSVLAYANGFTLWHYTTPDAAAAVDTAGYFNSASEMLRVGDMILANVETEGTMKAGGVSAECTSPAKRKTVPSKRGLAGRATYVLCAQSRTDMQRRGVCSAETLSRVRAWPVHPIHPRQDLRCLR